MTEVGILLHVRHPQTQGWEKLVWGVPAEDRLGSLPMAVMLLLRQPASEPVTTIVMGTTDATKDGLSEGEYTKQYLLRHFNVLSDFPRLRALLGGLSVAQKEKLRASLENIIITPIVKNTFEEVVCAAGIFAARGVQKVMQVTAASHGPRCLQVQSQVRELGDIMPGQLWSVVVDDMCFEGTGPETTLIFEAPHRGDDPMLAFDKKAAVVLRPYWRLPPAEKKLFLNQAAAFMAAHGKNKT